jgi:hypothetical protein
MEAQRSLTYVEIDIPAFPTGDSPNIPDTTFRFAIDTGYLPREIDAVPSIKEVTVTPATLSLGENLGQRGTLTAAFKDHRHVFDGEDFDSGSFWGKFRARYGLKLRGRAIRLIRGLLPATFTASYRQTTPLPDDVLDQQESRHYVIDSQDGPDAGGEYRIIGKDVLKLADDNRAQAPVLSNGFLVADITAVATTATLSPAGIGNAGYPASGYVAIGGKEICAFTRAADVLTLTRAQFNTTATTHAAQDRVQLCLRYNGEDPADIIDDLLVNYAGVDPAFIPIDAWETETAAYLGTVYTALIAEPTGVNKLIAELIEQAAMAIWWDDVGQQIRLQVLRAVPTTADVYGADNTLEGTLAVKEQPDKRISEVQVYFAKINPCVKEDQDDNYRSTARVADAVAVSEYGGAVIKKIRSRWIPSGGRAVAETAGNKQLGRFRDPPRRINFELLRYAGQDPALGGGYRLGGWPFQDVAGAAVELPIQVVRLNPEADRFKLEAEEMLWTPFGGDIDPTVRTVIFDVDQNNVNLRTVHDTLYPLPQAGDSVTAIVQDGVIIGSTSTSLRAFDVGSWPAGVTLLLRVIGRIQGHGGAGADAGPFLVAGENGGVALYTRRAISLDVDAGEIFGGAGGGGANTLSGGGGGAGDLPGTAGGGTYPGSAGSTEAGGAGGPGIGLPGGAGGGPGLAGAAATGSHASAGGAPGAAIDGVSFITVTEGPGDIRGGQIN